MSIDQEQLAQLLTLDEIESGLERALLEWRDAGAPVGTVVGAISDLIDARVEFALSIGR